MNETTAEICADWWAERFLIDDKRAAFRAEIFRRFITGECDEQDRRGNGTISLQVDYDPFGTLLDVVRSIGVPCSGYMCSADGILLKKRKMWIRADGTVEVSDGRGSVFQILVGERPHRSQNTTSILVLMSTMTRPRNRHAWQNSSGTTAR